MLLLLLLRQQCTAEPQLRTSDLWRLQWRGYDHITSFSVVVFYKVSKHSDVLL